MFYTFTCPQCEASDEYSLNINTLTCTQCQQTFDCLPILFLEIMTLYQNKNYEQCTRLAIQYIALNNSNSYVYTYAAASHTLHHLDISKEQIEQCFELFQHAYQLATTENERLFALQEMRVVIHTLFLYHLQQALQTMNINDIAAVEQTFAMITAVPFKDENVHLQFFIELAAVHKRMATEIERHFIRTVNSYHANDKRSGQDAKEYIMHLLFYGLALRFLSKRSEILHKIEQVDLSESLHLMYDLLVRRYEEELSLTYYITIDDAGAEYREVKLQLEQHTYTKLRTMQNVYADLAAQIQQ